MKFLPLMLVVITTHSPDEITANEPMTGIVAHRSVDGTTLHADLMIRIRRPWIRTDRIVTKLSLRGRARPAKDHPPSEKPYWLTAI